MQRDSADERRRREGLARLGTAAALETLASVHCVSAWDLAGRMPEGVRLAIRVAARDPISDAASRKVRALLAEWRGRPECRGTVVRYS